jgi:hypothetical protein
MADIVWKYSYNWWYICLSITEELVGLKVNISCLLRFLCYQQIHILAFSNDYYILE